MEIKMGNISKSHQVETPEGGFFNYEWFLSGALHKIFPGTMRITSSSILPRDDVTNYQYHIYHTGSGVTVYFSEYFDKECKDFRRPNGVNIRLAGQEEKVAEIERIIDEEAKVERKEWNA